MKRHLKQAVLIVMLLTACISCKVWTFAGTNGTTAAAGATDITILDGKAYRPDGKMYTGWMEKGEYSYYYAKGNKVTGWRKIEDKRYCFDKKGRLEKNRIASVPYKGKYYYVDKDGVLVQGTEMRKAVDFVMQNSGKKNSEAVRLKQCYQALCRYPYQRIMTNTLTASNMPVFARYMFNNRQGNCYRYACAMAYIARALGYQTRVAVGGVTARGPYAALSPHGWCEVKIDGKWKMIDCSMGRAYKNVNIYLVTRKQYPFRLRCDQVFTMKIKDGAVAWQ